MRFQRAGFIELCAGGVKRMVRPRLDVRGRLRGFLAWCARRRVSNPGVGGRRERVGSVGCRVGFRSGAGFSMETRNLVLCWYRDKHQR